MGRSRKRKAYLRRQRKMQSLALERIKYLFSWADSMIETYPDYAHKAVATARKIAMGTKVSIPLDLKRRVCHGCKHYLKPGVNMRFRMHHRKGYGSWLAVTCLDCGHITRYVVKGSAYHPKTKESQ